MAFHVPVTFPNFSAFDCPTLTSFANCSSKRMPVQSLSTRHSKVFSNALLSQYIPPPRPYPTSAPTTRSIQPLSFPRSTMMISSSSFTLVALPRVCQSLYRAVYHGSTRLSRSRIKFLSPAVGTSAIKMSPCGCKSSTVSFVPNSLTYDFFRGSMCHIAQTFSECSY